MKYYKDINNNPFVFEDNVTDEIIAKVEDTHKITLTEITLSEYEALIAPTFEELQIAKIQEIEIAYNNANHIDIAYMNTIFQANKYSQDLIVIVLSAGSVPSGFYWLDKANNKIPMTYTDLQGLSGTLLARGQANFDKRLQLKTQVKQATTQADLDAIVW